MDAGVGPDPAREGGGVNSIGTESVVRSDAQKMAAAGRKEQEEDAPPGVVARCTVVQVLAQMKACDEAQVLTDVRAAVTADALQKLAHLGLSGDANQGH